MDPRYMYPVQGPQGAPFSGCYPIPAMFIPRVPITSSTLHAHAIMMGPGAEGSDSLNTSLYQSPHRGIPDHRAIVPESRPDDLEVLPKGTVFYWDPLYAYTPNQRQIEPKDLALDTQVQKRLYPLTLTFDEFIKQNPSTVGANHYKDHLVYGNFGYVPVGERWADPDSQGDLAQAYEGQSEEYRLPEVYRSKSKGPRVMNPEELNQFYDAFADDVSDDEGHPRARHVHSSTYAKWAEGAVRGNQYEERVFPASSLLPPDIKAHKSQYKPKELATYQSQYDLQSGSELSGQYEVDSAPSLILNHPGVDYMQIPFHFSRNSPATAARMNKVKFLTGWMSVKSSTLSSSTASTPETFYSCRGHGNMATSENPDGVEEWNRRKNEILELREQADESVKKTNKQLEDTNRSGTAWQEKQMEGFYIARRAAETPAMEAAITTSLQTKGKYREIPLAHEANQISPIRKQAYVTSSAARLRKYEEAQLSTLLSPTPPDKLKKTAPVQFAPPPPLEDFSLYQEPVKPQSPVKSSSFEELAASLNDTNDAAAPLPIQSQPTHDLRRKGPINFSSVIRLREFILAQAPLDLLSLEDLAASPIDTKDPTSPLPVWLQPGHKLQRKTPRSFSSAARLRDFNEAQEPLNSLSFEDLAISLEEARAAAIPLPKSPEQVSNPLEDPTPALLFTGPIPLYIANPASPSVDLSNRRIRSQYRRHLTELCEDEKISISKSELHYDKYVKDELKFNLKASVKGRLNRENLEKMGVETIPKGLIPEKEEKPKIEFKELANQQQQQQHRKNGR